MKRILRTGLTDAAGNFITRAEQFILINKIVDLAINDKIPILIKSCSHSIKAMSSIWPNRPGRFIMNIAEHENLKITNGYYLFIVKRDQLIVAWKFIKADKINFKRNLQWDKVIERRYQRDI